MEERRARIGVCRFVESLAAASQSIQAEVNRLLKLYQDPEYVRIVEKMQVVNQQSARIMFEQVPGIMKSLQPLLEETVQKALAK